MAPLEFWYIKILSKDVGVSGCTMMKNQLKPVAVTFKLCSPERQSRPNFEDIKFEPMSCD